MALVDRFEGIIFDYGGVLVHHQTDDDQSRLAALTGIPQDRFTELYWSLREEYDKGLLTAAEYWQLIARESGTSLSLEMIEQLTELDTKTWMHFDTLMWEWVEQLREAGKRVAMLSNMPRDLGEALKTTTNRLSRFDHVTLSYEVHSAKPEPAIYEHCLEGLETPAEGTLFLDDRMANVHGAEMLGMRAMQFLDRDDVLLQLRS